MRQIGSISDPHAGFVRQCDAPRGQDALNALHWKVADNQSPRREYFESFRRSLALVAEEVAASEHANAVVDENGELYTVRYEAVNSMCFMRSSSNPLQKLEAVIAKQRKMESTREYSVSKNPGGGYEAFRE